MSAGPRISLGVLDSEFDEIGEEGGDLFGEYEQPIEMGYGADGPRITRAQSARKRKKAIDTESDDVRTLPEEEPPGWAEP